MTDDLAVFLPLLIYGLAAALVGYLVGTWPSKRPMYLNGAEVIPVTEAREWHDKEMATFSAGHITPESHRVEMTALNEAWKRYIANPAIADKPSMISAGVIWIPPSNTETSDAGRVSPGAETAAADASAPVEKGRPDQETGDPAASEFGTEIGQQLETRPELIGAKSIPLTKADSDDRDFTAGVPRVPCATPFANSIPITPGPIDQVAVDAAKKLAQDNRDLIEEDAARVFSGVSRAQEAYDALPPEGKRITDMINNMTPPPAWPKTEEEAVAARETISNMIEEGYAIGDAIRDAFGLPRFPHAPKTPHIDQHAPGFAARARKAKAKKGKK